MAAASAQRALAAAQKDGIPVKRWQKKLLGGTGYDPGSAQKAPGAPQADGKNGEPPCRSFLSVAKGKPGILRPQNPYRKSVTVPARLTREPSRNSTSTTYV
jgi:hypothetical protein